MLLLVSVITTHTHAHKRTFLFIYTQKNLNLQENVLLLLSCTKFELYIIGFDYSEVRLLAGLWMAQFFFMWLYPLFQRCISTAIESMSCNQLLKMNCARTFSPALAQKLQTLTDFHFAQHIRKKANFAEFGISEGSLRSTCVQTVIGLDQMVVRIIQNNY